MTQHDMLLDNASGGLFRADANSALQALASTSKGSSRPSTPYAGQLWIDDNTPSASVWTLFCFDGSDDIPLGHIDSTSNIFYPFTAAGSASAPPIRYSGDADTGIFFPAADTVATTTGGTEASRSTGGRTAFGTTTIVTQARATFAGSITITGADTDLSAGGNRAFMDYASGYARVGGNSGVGVSFFAGGSERARIDTSGNLLVGVTSGSTHYISKPTAGITDPLLLIGQNGFNAAQFHGGGDQNWNAAAAVLFLGRNTINGRGLNVGGTVNMNGADYAEYVRKRDDCGDIAKGDICGRDEDGLLTRQWALAVSFCVKSTNPSLVGGNAWGTEEAIGPQPRLTAEPEKPADDAPARTKSAYRTALVKYEADLARWQAEYREWAARLEEERGKYDRIAFCGVLPCNVAGAKPGDYIVAANNHGGIQGLAVSPKDYTFDMTHNTVGRVSCILADGRAEIVVKPC